MYYSNTAKLCIKRVGTRPYFRDFFAPLVKTKAQKHTILKHGREQSVKQNLVSLQNFSQNFRVETSACQNILAYKEEAGAVRG